MMMTELETTEKMGTQPLIGQPCEDDSIDEADYRRKLVAAVEEARESIKRGEFVTHEELEHEYFSWTFE